MMAESRAAHFPSNSDVLIKEELMLEDVLDPAIKQEPDDPFDANQQQLHVDDASPTSPPADDTLHCGTCHQPFPTKARLREHMATKHNLLVPPRTLHAAHTRNHTQGPHLGAKSYACHTCHQPFPTKSRLRAHMATKHNLLVPPRTLHAAHTRNHTQGPHLGAKSYACPTCNKSFTQSRYLRIHQSIHAGLKTYTCNTCDKLFTNSYGLRSHQRTHSGEKPYTCSTCNKSFTYNSCLTIHERTHSGEKPYTCSTCNKSFTYNSCLTIHERTHSGEKPYTCSTCNKSFTHNSGLKYHERTHSGEQPYTCSTCHKSFTHNSGLKYHERTHSGEQPYTCSTCNKSFTHNSGLKYHDRTHSGEQPYTCSTCNKSFTHNSGLKNHERTHSGEQPYTCSTCNKSFSLRYPLTRHLLIHTRLTLFTCPACHKSFTRSDSLKEHERVHTGMNALRVGTGKALSAKKYLTRHRLIFSGKNLKFGVTGSCVGRGRNPTQTDVYTCAACGGEFLYRRGIVGHVQTSLAGTRCECCVCGETLVQSCALGRHLTAHANSTSFNCTVLLHRLVLAP